MWRRDCLRSSERVFFSTSLLMAFVPCYSHGAAKTRCCAAEMGLDESEDTPKIVMHVWPGFTIGGFSPSNVNDTVAKYQLVDAVSQFSGESKQGGSGRLAGVVVMLDLFQIAIVDVVSRLAEWSLYRHGRDVLR